MVGAGERRCDACGGGPLAAFADLGEIPVQCGVHFGEREDALRSPVGRMLLGFCPDCAYVRNLAFEPDALVYDTSMDTNLHHSPAFQRFSTELVLDLASRWDLSDATILDIGCGQGEFLRELCDVGGARGFGYDAMYAGPPGSSCGAHFTTGFAPVDDPVACPVFDVFVSRHWFEHLDDPYGFLVALRERAGDRPVHGYVEVPDAGYDLSTAGWEVIYPHVSYFARAPLARIFERAGWIIEAEGTLFSGMFRFIEVSANISSATCSSPVCADRTPDRDRQVAAIGGFAARHAAERDRWRSTVDSISAAGGRPVLWGAGSRGVQFLTLADPHRRLTAVVDVNPRKWGRFLPVTGHRVEDPEILRLVQPTAVIITNPAYRAEIGKSLAGLGVSAEILAG